MDSVVRNLPFEEYKALPGINGSLLKIVDEFSLAHAKAQIDGICERESDALDFGTCFHSLLLEGRVDYAVEPETYPAPKDHEKVKKGAIKEGDPLPWNNNAGICKNWLKDQGDKIPLTKREAESLEAMVAAVSEQEELKPFLNGDTELSVFAEKDGVPLKSRLDLLPASGPIIDFKKTRCAQPQEFLKQSLNLRYHMGAAWNIDTLALAGDRRSEFWLVGIEEKPPFAVCILKFKDTPMSFLRVGRKKCRAAFDKLKAAHASKHWPAYGSHPAEEWAAPWMLPELEQTA